MIVTLWVGASLRLSAATIYDNSVNDLNIRFHPGTLEVGDEILLAGTERYLTQFDFEYFGTNSASPGNVSFAGPVQARVRFYKNDGAPFNGYNTPGTVFYDSGWFGGFGPTPRNTLVFTISGGDFPGSGLFIPVSDLTWSVQFQGMGATDDLGVDLYSPPVVGSSVPGTGFVQDYWENNGGWTLKTDGGTDLNFAARFFAEQNPVPEPSAIVLSFVGGLGLLAAARRRRGKV
jgi:hypothetical protein